MIRKLALFIFLLPSLVLAADLGPTALRSSPFSDQGPSAFDTHPIDSATDGIEWIFQCEAPDTITDLGFLYGARAGTPCAQQVSLQGVNGSGRADGTIKSATNAKASFTPPANSSIDGLWQWKTLTSSYTCTRGEFLSIVISDVSDGCTPAATTAESTYAYQQSNTWPGTDFPHPFTVVSGVGTQKHGLSIYGYKSATRSYGNVVQTQATQDFGQDSTPDERGNSFTLPAGACDTFQINGVKIFGYLDCGGSTVTVALYSGTTVLQDVDVDCDVWAVPGVNNVFKVFFNEATLATLTCGSTYRIASHPHLDGGTKSGMVYFTVGAAADMSAYPLGTSMFATSRTDAGAWTDDTVRRNQIDLYISDITEPAGGGGGGAVGAYPAMNGGMQ